ncbi:MAG: hypothetical protein IKP65_02260, partial [Alphaproteobacteria bacterium]|nr:hypothetical protein [Alphaproteobacteria bacterium]
MTAYVSDNITPGDYPIERASYLQREKTDQPIIYAGRRCTVPPQILAATDDGADSYQEYYSGDLVYGQVKEYFPSGYTWWFMKQVLGGRYTSHKGGKYHMDDSNTGAGYMEGGGGGIYTRGSKTVSYCAVSIYGLLPLDKEIVKAYAIIFPSSENPSKNPVGKSWNGASIMYHHYHAFTQQHKSRDPRYINNEDYKDGKIAHLHGTAGFGDGIFFDADGNKCQQQGTKVVYLSNDIKYQDESAYRFY